MLEGGWKRFNDNLHLLKNIHYYYQTSTTLGKQAFLSLVFDGKLFYHEGALRTPYIISLFAPKVASLMEKGLLYMEQPKGFDGKITIGAAEESPHEHLAKLIDWSINYRKAA